VKKLPISLILLLATLFLFFACVPENEITITFYIYPPNSGTANATNNNDGTYTIKAIPNENWKFDHWSGSVQGNINNYVITPTGSLTITANFVETSENPGWLFMAFMAGNSGLGDALWEDTNEMEHGLYLLEQAGQSIDMIKIAVLFDGESSSHPDNKLYVLGPDSTVNTTASASTIDYSSEKWWTGDVDTGSATTVKEFIQWAETKFPSYSHRMLLLSDHGGGPGKKAGKDTIKSVCGDSSSGNTIHTWELRTSLEEAGFDSNNKLTIIGMDACDMGYIEEGYEYRNVSEYFIGSIKGEPGDGWEFHYWLPNITESSSGDEVARQIVLAYKQNYYPNEALTGADLSQMDNLKTAINNLATSIISNSEQSAANSAYYNSNYGEFGQFCVNVETGSFSQATKDLATAAKNILGDAVVYTYAGTYDGNFEGFGYDVKKGLSITNYNNSSLEFSQGNTWGTW